MKLKLIPVVVLLFASLMAHATEFHVATQGSDANPGTRRSPFRTIQHAADLAQAGDLVAKRVLGYSLIQNSLASG
jgi:alpha-L-arabinofuranosidase